MGWTRHSLHGLPVFFRFECEFSGFVTPCGRSGAVKKSRFIEEQIAFALKRAEAGMALAEVLCRTGNSSLRSLEEELYGRLDTGNVWSRSRRRAASSSSWSRTSAS